MTDERFCRYSHPVHLATFEAQWAQLKEALALEGPARDKAVDPFFVATFLGVLAMGLSMMPAKRALRDGFVGNKDRIVDHWLEGAMVSLTIGRVRTLNISSSLCRADFFRSFWTILRSSRFVRLS